MTFLQGRLPWLLVIALAAGTGCGEAGPETKGPPAQQKQREAIPVTVAPVRYEPLDQTIDVVGTLYGDEQAVISAKVPGRVNEVFVDMGERVAANAVLAQIDPTDYRIAVTQRAAAVREALSKLGLSELPPADFDVNTVATVERARLQAANANARYERAQVTGSQTPLIAEQELADLRTAAQVAERDFEVAKLEAQSWLALAKTRQSELEAAEQRLADTTVRAPGAPHGPPASRPAASATPTTQVSDIPLYAITRRRISLGEYLREGDPMFEILVDDPIRMRAAVPERHLAQIKTGQMVHVKVESYDSPFEGTVSRINPAIDQASRTFQIEINVSNPRRLLRPGAFGRGTVIVGRNESVPFVPEDAVVSFAGIDRIFSIADGKAVEHIAQLGPKRGDHIAVLKGLSNEQSVVISGHQRLANQDPVAVHPAAPTQARANGSSQ